MTDLLDEWERDSIVDLANPTMELTRCMKLHAKYLRYLAEAKVQLRDLQTKFRTLKCRKTQWLLEGPSQETQALGWKYPIRGKLLRSDVGLFLDADPDIQDLNNQIDELSARVELLQDILRALHSRHFAIKTAVEWYRLQNP